MTRIDRPDQQPFRGILCKILSVVTFVAMAACIKSASATVPAGETVFFRSAFALPIIFGWLAIRGQLSTGLRVASPMAHMFRGFAGTSAMALGFAGLAFLPLPEFVAIGYTAPLLVVIFAAMFLGEEVRLFRMSAVALGFVGVAIILAPRLTVLSGGLEMSASFGALLVLMSACFAALAQVFIRNLVRTETTTAIVFWFTISSTCFSLLTIPFGWMLPDPATFAILVLAGLLGGCGQILLTSSYRYAEASLVAPFEYVSMLVSIAIGYAVFGEVPSLAVLGGAVVVIMAGVLIIWRERQLGLQRGKARGTTTPHG